MQSQQRTRSYRPYVICIENKGFESSLEVAKLYEVVPDQSAESHGLTRVVDESGEDYLYPADWFVGIALRAAKYRPVAAAIETRSRPDRRESRRHAIATGRRRRRCSAS